MLKIAVLIESEYEDLEYWYPKLRLMEEGFEVVTLHLESDHTFKSKHGYPTHSTAAIRDVKVDQFEAVIIPGGWAPDKMRTKNEMVSFVREAFQLNKIIVAICHAGSMLVSAGIVRNKTVTSFESIKHDLLAAGAEWVDMEVVVDLPLVTSRTPDDLPALMRELVPMLKGKSPPRTEM